MDPDGRRAAAKLRKAAEESRARDVPEPISLRRRRDVSTVREEANSTSPLLSRLPKELRVKIWQYAMNSGGQHIHLMHGTGEFGHAVCGAGSHEEAAPRGSPCCESRALRSCCPKTHIGFACLWNGGCVMKGMQVHNLFPPHPDAEWESHPRLDLTLLRVCRQIYNEAVELPYATNIFDVDDLITLVYWSRTILPSRLKLVRDLRVDWKIYWPPYTKTDPSGMITSQTACPFDRIRLKHSNLVWWEFWLVVSRMTGLRDVRMTLGFLSGYYHCESLKRLFGPDQGLPSDLGAAWLQPILNVGGLTNFELVISDGDCGVYYLGESGPRQPDPAEEERRSEFLQKLSAYMTTEGPRRNICGPGFSEEALRAEAQSY